MKGFTVLANNPIQGAADFVKDRKSMATEQVAEELRSHVLQNAIAVPGARGPIETFQRIINRIRGRRLVSDLGNHEFSVNFLTFHVPPGGKGTLKLTDTSNSRFGFHLKIMGLGYGEGRSITISVNRDFGERNSCLLLSQRVVGHVVAYSSADSQVPDELQLNIIRITTQSQTSLPDCPDCHGVSDMSMVEQAGQAIDLTKDTVGQTYNEKFSLSDDSEIELGLPLTLPIDVTPSVVVKRNIQIDVEIRYDFPGGYCFTPFRKLTSWEDFHFWRRASSCL